MRWNCPHCQKELFSNAGSDSGHGWIFGRCSACSGYASIDTATGAAVKIEPKAKAQPAPAPMPAPEQILIDDPKVIQAELIQGPVSTRRALSQHHEAIAQAQAVPRRRSSAIVLGLATAALAVGSAVALGEYIFKVTRPAPSAIARANAAAQKLAPPAPAPEVVLANRPISDSIHAAAMAPERPQPADQPTGVTARARKGARSIQMRAGPGDDFALTGLADLQNDYPVLEWKNHWFKISLGENGKTAWVHNNGIDLAYREEKGKQNP